MSRRSEKKSKPTFVHELTIPDELIAWGKQPQVARSFVKPWAHEVERFIKRATNRPLSDEDTESLLSRLEALCVEAIRAGQQELLLGLDLFVSDWIGLRFSFPTENGNVTFGETFTYGELHRLIEAQAKPSAVAFAMRCKSLVSEVFPRSQIGAIIDAETAAAEACYDCGKRNSAVMFALDTGSKYCPSCYSHLTRKWPTPEELKAKGKKGNRK